MPSMLMSPVSRRAVYRGRSTSECRASVKKGDAEVTDVDGTMVGSDANGRGKGNVLMTKEEGTRLSNKSETRGARPNMMMSPVSRRAVYRGRSTSRSRTSVKKGDTEATGVDGTATGSAASASAKSNPSTTKEEGTWPSNKPETQGERPSMMMSPVSSRALYRERSTSRSRTSMKKGDAAAMGADGTTIGPAANASVKSNPPMSREEGTKPSNKPETQGTRPSMMMSPVSRRAVYRERSTSRSRTSVKKGDAEATGADGTAIGSTADAGGKGNTSMTKEEETRSSDKPATRGTMPSMLMSPVSRRAVYRGRSTSECRASVKKGDAEVTDVDGTMVGSDANAGGKGNMLMTKEEGTRLSNKSETQGARPNMMMSPVSRMAVFRARSASRSRASVKKGGAEAAEVDGAAIGSPENARGNGTTTTTTKEARLRPNNKPETQGARPSMTMSPVLRRTVYRGRSTSRSRASMGDSNGGKNVPKMKSPLLKSGATVAATRTTTTAQLEMKTSPLGWHISKDLLNETKPPLSKKCVTQGDMDGKASNISALSSATPKKEEEKNKKEAPYIHDNGEMSNTVDILVRLRHQRARSRSPACSPCSQPPPKRSSSSPPKRSGTPSSMSKKPPKDTSTFPTTPPRNTALGRPIPPTNQLSWSSSSPSRKTPPRKATPKTPPGTVVAPRRGTPVSSLTRHNPKKQQPKTKVQGGGAAVVNHFDILRPSKLASLSILDWCRGAVPMQRLARRCLAKSAFEKRKRNTVVVQSVVRRWASRRYLESARTIALRFQGVYRGVISRDELRFRHYCATRMQASVRGFLGILSFMETIHRVILVQNIWRMKSQRKQFVAYTDLLSGVTLMQSHARRWLAMKSFRKKKENKAALTIQTNFRRYGAMMGFLMLILDVVLCQAVVRQFLASKHAAALRYARNSNAALVIQTNLRRHRAMVYLSRYKKAALLLQTHFRKHVAMVDFAYHISDVILCQAVARRLLASRHTIKLGLGRDSEAALMIQKNVRRHRAMVDFVYLVADVMLCQAVARRLLALRHTIELRRRRDNMAALMIQKNVRRHRAMLDFVCQISDVILCQAVVRRLLALRHTLKLRRRRDNKAALMIQKNVRRQRAMLDFVFQISDVLLCQAVTRRLLALRHTIKLRRRRDNKAALMIQKNVRRHRAMVYLSCQVLKVIRCQTSARQFLALKHTMKLREVKCVTKIQAVWRRYTVSVRIILENKAATIIQTHYRGYQDFLSYVVKSFCVSQIQACGRRYVATCLLKRLKQERLRFLNAACVAVQSCYRRHRDLKLFVVKKYIIIELQTRVRSYQARCQLQRLKQEKEEERILILQATAATIIQACFRKYRHFVRYVICQYFIIKIQSCVRGHQAQCRLRKLKREERNKKIEKNKRLSDVMSRVSYRTKKNDPRAAGDVSLSSLYFSPRNKKRLSVPTVREDEEKKAALVIERFFIKIKAEIEWEILQLQQRELSFKRNSEKKRKSRTKRSFSRK